VIRPLPDDFAQHFYGIIVRFQHVKIKNIPTFLELQHDCIRKPDPKHFSQYRKPQLPPVTAFFAAAPAKKCPQYKVFSSKKWCLFFGA
jgi:hypothetical protein